MLKKIIKKILLYFGLFYYLFIRGGLGISMKISGKMWLVVISNKIKCVFGIFFVGSIVFFRFLIDCFYNKRGFDVLVMDVI